MKTKAEAYDFAIVENAGTDDEKIIVICPNQSAAMHYMETDGKNQHLDVMKRMPDGTLTTEY